MITQINKNLTKLTNKQLELKVIIANIKIGWQINSKTKEQELKVSFKPITISINLQLLILTLRQVKLRLIVHSILVDI